jgi:hypothetical protein
MIFLGINSKVWVTKAKTDKWDYPKQNVSSWQRKQGKIVSHYTSDKGLCWRRGSSGRAPV